MFLGVLAVSASSVGLAIADSADIDGDTANLASSNISLSGAPCAFPATYSGDLQLTYSNNAGNGAGESGQHYLAGEALSIVVTSDSGISSGATSVTPHVAATWNTNGQKTHVAISTSISSAVSNGTHSVQYTVTGQISGTVRVASFTVTVSCTTGGGGDTTAPQNASVTIDGGANWTNNSSGDVTLDLAATDNVGVVRYRLAGTQTDLDSAADNNVASTTSFTAPGVAFSLGGVEDSTRYVWARFYDAAGNHTDVDDTIGWDHTPPTILDEGVSAGTEGSNGWYKTAVTNDFAASDILSGLDSACAAAFPNSVQTSSEGLGITVSSGSCADVAGNSNPGVVSAGFNIDSYAPVITNLGVSAGTLGSNGWYTSPVTNDFSAADEGASGMDSACAAAFPKSVETTTEGAAVSVSSGSCSDVAGNVNSGIVAGPFKIDLTDPNIACRPATFLPNANHQQVLADVTDDLSGPADAVVHSDDVDTSAIGGPFQTSVTGYDNAGNSATVSCSYYVSIPVPEVVGLSSGSISGKQVDVDSYHGGLTVNNAGTVSYASESNGTVATDGLLTVSGATIAGSISLGPDPSSVQFLKGAAQNPNVSQRDSALPAAVPDPCGKYSGKFAGQQPGDKFSYDPNKGDLVVSGGNSLHLPGSGPTPYCFHNVTVSGGSKLYVSDAVQINMLGQFNASGGSLINLSYDPVNLQISTTYQGNNAVVLSGGSNAYALIYAPAGGVTLSGGSPLFGAVLGKTLVMSGDSKVHCDTTPATLEAWSAMWG